MDGGTASSDHNPEPRKQFIENLSAIAITEVVEPGGIEPRGRTSKCIPVT